MMMMMIAHAMMMTFIGKMTYPSAHHCITWFLIFAVD